MGAVMSKSLKRVKRALEEYGVDTEVRETGDAKTARAAAEELSVHVDQIAKSIIFHAQASDRAVLFLTAGGNQVDGDKASALAGESLGKADAALVRAQTGFAIGGVSPVGHLSPIRTWIDPHLMTFDIIWAAAGTPRHVFGITPEKLIEITGAQVADFTA